MPAQVRAVATVGETIVGAGVSLGDEKFLRGFNTFSGVDSEGTSIVSAVCGVVEVTDCVVSVRGLNPRYMPEIGDVIVGRVVDVTGNRWRVDVNGLQDAIMLLSNVTEPGAVLRRRGRDDELSMRNIFKEDDVVVAEVQRISPDGLISLHTRTAEKYGRMNSCGRLVRVKPSIIRRTRHQFHTFLAHGVTIVVGMNGSVWVEVATEAQMHDAQRKLAEARGDSDNSGQEDDVEGDAGSSSAADLTNTAEIMHNLACFANCVDVLGRNSVVVFHKTILAAVQTSLAQGWRPYDILLPENEKLVARAAKESLLHHKRRRQ